MSSSIGMHPDQYEIEFGLVGWCVKCEDWMGWHWVGASECCDECGEVLEMCR